MNDTQILNALEELFKRSRRSWPLIGLQTISDMVGLAAINKHHGNEAGLIIAGTIREAVEVFVKRENIERMRDNTGTAKR